MPIEQPPFASEPEPSGAGTTAAERTRGEAPGHSPGLPDILIDRFRRLVTLWRGLFITQIVLLLVLVLAGLMEATLPGSLARMTGGTTRAMVAVSTILGLMLLLDPAATLVELLMARQVRVSFTPGRWIRFALLMVPGAQLLRRTLALLGALIWGLLVVLALLLWFLLTLMMTPVILVSDRAAALLGRAVDGGDQVLGAVIHGLRWLLRHLGVSPVHRIEQEDHMVLPLLHHLTAPRRGDPAPKTPSPPAADPG